MKVEKSLEGKRITEIEGTKVLSSFLTGLFDKSLIYEKRKLGVDEGLIN